MNNLTQQLNGDQLKANIDALLKQGISKDQVQAYVNNYAPDSSGGYVLKGSNQTPTGQMPTDQSNSSDLLHTYDSTSQPEKTPRFGLTPFGQKNVGKVPGVIKSYFSGLSNTYQKIFGEMQTDVEQGANAVSNNPEKQGLGDVFKRGIGLFDSSKNLGAKFLKGAFAPVGQALTMFVNQVANSSGDDPMVQKLANSQVVSDTLDAINKAGSNVGAFFQKNPKLANELESDLIILSSLMGHKQLDRPVESIYQSVEARLEKVKEAMIGKEASLTPEQIAELNKQLQSGEALDLQRAMKNGELSSEDVYQTGSNVRTEKVPISQIKDAQGMSLEEAKQQADLTKNGLETFNKTGGTPDESAFHGARIGRQVTEPVKANLNPDGTYSITDGNHRLRQALINGDKTIPMDIVDNSSGILKPELAQGRIDDVINKMNRVSPGLGDEFKSQIDVNNVKVVGNNPQELIDQANAFIKEKGLSKPGFFGNPDKPVSANIDAPGTQPVESPTYQKQLQENLELTKPNLNKKASIAALEKSGQPGGVEGVQEVGGLKTYKLKPDKGQISVAKSLMRDDGTSIISKSNGPIDNISNINQEIARVSESEVSPFLEKNPSAYNSAQLNSYIKNSVDIPNYIKSDATLQKIYDLTRDSMVEAAKEKPGTMSGLWDARKDFYKIAERQMGSLDPTSEKFSAAKQAVLDTGKAVNTYIAENTPNGDANFLDKMFRLSNLYEARGNIAENYYSLLNKNFIQRWMELNPVKAGTLKWGLGGTVGAKILKELGII